MRRDLRFEILMTAKKLFNERGFNGVSISDIADALGISKGNLTYYFTKKEEIVETIIAENHYAPPEAPRNITELNDFFLHMQQVVQNNAFYFWHHTQLSQLSPSIREKQNAIYLSNTKKLALALKTLQSDGILHPDSFPGEYDRIIDTLLLSIIYWIPFHDLRQKNDSQASFQQHAWFILYHLLTEKGISLLKDIVSFELVSI